MQVICSRKGKTKKSLVYLKGNRVTLMSITIALV